MLGTKRAAQVKVGEEIVFAGDSNFLPGAGTTDSLVVWLFRPFNCPAGGIAFLAAVFCELAAVRSGGKYVADTGSCVRRHRIGHVAACVWKSQSGTTLISRLRMRGPSSRGLNE